MELNSAVLTIVNVHHTEAPNSGFYQDKDYKVIKLFYSFLDFIIFQNYGNFSNIADR